MTPDTPGDAPVHHRDDRVRNQRLRMQRKLDYTQEGVRVLKDVLAAIAGSGRISFTAERRRRLAIAGKELKSCPSIGQFLASRAKGSAASPITAIEKPHDARRTDFPDTTAVATHFPAG